MAKTHGDKVHSDLVWQPRAVSVENSVVQYSRFVSRMKIGLPVAAGLILLLVLLLPQFRAESDRFRIGLKNVTDITSDNLSMMNARYFGTDDKGQPYSVNASSVRERSGEDKLIDLESPKAESTMKDGAKSVVTATTGVYDRNGQILDLAGQVDVNQDNGNALHTVNARVFLKDSVATGTGAVTAKGSFGEVEGVGFTMRQNENVVIFNGPAKLTLSGEKTDIAAPPAAPQAAPAASAQKPSAKTTTAKTPASKSPEGSKR